MYPETVIAEQLGKVLLSRIVLLDSTAQVKLLPFIFKPKGYTFLRISLLCLYNKMLIILIIT
jgi:hypothetical protein